MDCVCSLVMFAAGKNRVACLVQKDTLVFRFGFLFLSLKRAGLLVSDTYTHLEAMPLLSIFVLV